MIQIIDCSMSANRFLSPLAQSSVDSMPAPVFHRFAKAPRLSISNITVTLQRRAF